MILIADVAALATEANKITIEKDWVVVMAHGDQDTLACELSRRQPARCGRGGGATV